MTCLSCRQKSILVFPPILIYLRVAFVICLFSPLCIFVHCQGPALTLFYFLHPCLTFGPLHRCQSVSLFLFLYLFIKVRSVGGMKDEVSHAMFKDVQVPRFRWITLSHSLSVIWAHMLLFCSYHPFSYTCSHNLVKTESWVGYISHHLDPTKVFFFFCSVSYGLAESMPWLWGYLGLETLFHLFFSLGKHLKKGKKKCLAAINKSSDV